MDKVWFITGASKGIGKAIAETVLKNGDCAVITSRNEITPYTEPKHDHKALYLKLDVTEQDKSVYDRAIRKAIDKFGKIDYLVNNAGHGRITNFEETSDENIKELFEVNLFGMMRTTKAVLPVMRKQRAGHIFNVSSGASYCGGPAAYHSSKFAVTGFSAALEFELKQFGIKVTNIVPGLIRTNFYDKNTLPVEPDIHIDDYDNARWQTDFMKSNSHNEQPGDPYKVAEIVFKAAYSDNPPLHLPVSADVVEVIDEWQKRIKEDNDNWRGSAMKN